MIFIACPPVYTLPGTWSDPEKIAKCTETLIPHFSFSPDYTFGISIAVITILLAGYGVYKGCLLYTSPSPRDLSTSRMPSSA